VKRADHFEEEIRSERKTQVVGRLDGTFNELEGNKQGITAISSSGLSPSSLLLIFIECEFFVSHPSSQLSYWICVQVEKRKRGSAEVNKICLFVFPSLALPGLPFGPVVRRIN